MTKVASRLAVRRTVRLREDVATPGGGPRVDRARGIVYGVKIIGQESSNERRYTAECLRAAVPLYEGVGVNADHPDDPDDQRSIRDRLGVFRNVRYERGAIYGDLHLIKAHPMAGPILEAAADPALARAFGASHNADGDVDFEGGRAVVKSINEVRSVDIVADPATTRGLFESVQRRKSPRTRGRRTMRLREWFDRIPLLHKQKRQVFRLLEAGYMDPDAEGPVMEDDDVASAAGASPTSDPADMDPEAALRAGFDAACRAVLDDTTMPAKEKAKRLSKLLTTMEKLLASGQEIPEGEGEELDELTEGDEDLDLEEGDLEIKHREGGIAEGEGDDEYLTEEDEDCDPVMETYGDDEDLVEAEDADEVLQPKKTHTPLKGAPPAPKGAVKAPGAKSSPVKESRLSLLRKVRRLQAHIAARSLCDRAGVRPTSALLEALSLLPGKAQRQALLEQVRGTKRRVRTHAYDPARPTAPEGQGRGGSTEDFVRRITSNQAGN